MKKVSENQTKMDLKIQEARKIAVCSFYEPEMAVRLAKSLLEKNVFAMEIAYRKLDSFEKTDECIKKVKSEVPEMLLGAATVINPSLAKRAVNVGSSFILSPGFNPKTADFCIKHKIPFYPGVFTPSEIEMALSFGLSTLKFFPCEPFGVSFLKSMKGPFPNVKFIVSGGINKENEEKYLSLENVAAVSGSYLSEI